jgi:hypothetical protein
MNVLAAFDENGQPMMTVEDSSVWADFQRSWLSWMK